MPTQTFWNLTAEKREALIAIAVEEFAEHDYLNASVSRIVARAGIAKGSLYQYFADKQELFLYLLEHSQQTLLTVVQEGAHEAHAANIFERLRQQMRATVRAALRYPLHARLAQRAYTAQLPFREQVLEQSRALRLNFLRDLVAQGQSQGDLEPALDPELAALVISATVAEIRPFLFERLGYTAQQAPIDPAQFDTAETERIFDDVLAILERGLRRRE